MNQNKKRVSSFASVQLQNDEYQDLIIQRNNCYRHYCNNEDRLVLKDPIQTRQYYHGTIQKQHHQVLLPQNLLRKLLESIHGTVHIYPGISKNLHELRQKNCYSSIANYVKKKIGAMKHKPKTNEGQIGP